jgi:hypothetical protein
VMERGAGVVMGLKFSEGLTFPCRAFYLL